jgi:glycosyltransferase involved in cell wall biosynthesis
LDKRLRKQVSVALCTYNGAEFIVEQLKSIEAQTLKPAEVVVVDDGSADESVKLVRQFAAQAVFEVRLIENEQQLGVNANFSRAIGLCRGEYVALSDQDDIWAADKLELSLAEMARLEGAAGSERPCLVHSDLKVCGSDGRVLATSFMRRQGLNHVEVEPLKRLMVRGFVTGATVLINRALVEAALPIPEEAVHHDWWLALVAGGAGRIGFVPQGLVYYRQHGNNVIGSKGYYSPGNMKRLGRLEELEMRVAASVRQGLALSVRLGQVGGALPGYIEDYLQAAQKNGRAAFLLAVKQRIGRPGFLRNLILLGLLLKGGYLKYL